MKASHFNFYSRRQSIAHAIRGIQTFFKREHNARIHAVATIVVILLSIILHTSTNETMIIIFVTAGVWSAELFNTAIEYLADFVHPGRNLKIKRIKDISAAAVLMMASVAFVTGSVIFIPKLLSL